MDSKVTDYHVPIIITQVTLRYIAKWAIRLTRINYRDGGIYLLLQSFQCFEPAHLSSNTIAGSGVLSCENSIPSFSAD